MARYSLAFGPEIGRRLVKLPPQAEKVGRDRMLELAEGPAEREARPAIERIIREIYAWRFIFSVDHRKKRVTLEEVIPSPRRTSSDEAGLFRH